MEWGLKLSNGGPPYIEMEERNVKAAKIAFNHTQITQFFDYFCSRCMAKVIRIEGPIPFWENVDILYDLPYSLSQYSFQLVNEFRWDYKTYNVNYIFPLSIKVLNLYTNYRCFSGIKETFCLKNMNI